MEKDHAPPSAILQQPERAEIQTLHIQGEKEPHDIFLSHSGQEKEFVKKLDRALRNAGYDPFFDVLSIPPGKRFPPHILRNAKECKLGVVVLSPGFLTSKWPMLELCSMHTSPHNPILLPLFFRIQPYDLKPVPPTWWDSWKNFFCIQPDDVKLVSPKWRDAWKKFEEKDPSRISIREWERAATELSNIQGEVYQTHMGEEQFIEAVLLRIGSIIRPPLRYDILHLTGHERLTLEVAHKFEEVPPTISSHRTACARGFFAVGGQGKTTICKLMVNHYASAYAGRCALIEFPSNNCNEKEVVRQCNKALQQLTNSSNIHHIDGFDQCLQQMSKQLSSLNVFIAIDNVWEISLHFAQRIMDVGFSRGSKLLVTSRSRQVLLNLLEDASYVKPLPGVNEKEAHKIFVKSFNRNQAGLDIRLEDADVHDVTNWLRYDGGYHPLTINAVGVSLGRTGGHDWHAAWKVKRHDFTGSGSVADEAIKINFNSIPKPRRYMFLDVALICIPMLEGDRQLLFLALFYNDVKLILLSAIYKGEMDKHEISMTLMQLGYDGLLEFEDSKVHVHDLYKELAAREAAASPRFMLVNKDNSWAQAERIVSCSDFEGISMPQDVSGLSVPKLRVLIARAGNGWGLIHMPQLRILSLRIDDRNQYNMDLRDMPELMWLELKSSSCTRFPELWVLKDISRLTCLSVLVLEDGNAGMVSTTDQDEDALARFQDEDEDLNGLCLDGLVNLQFLRIYGISALQKISGLGSLINLKYFDLGYLPELRKIGNFNSCFTQLLFLNIVHCKRLRVDVVGLISPPNLTSLIFLQQRPLSPVRQFLVFTAMDIHGMLALESLQLMFEDKGTGITVNVYGMPKLKTLRIAGGGVAEISCDAGLPRLESLEISHGHGLKQLDFSRFKGLTNLTSLEIYFCWSLKEIEWSSLNDLTSLTCLKITDCWELEEIRGEPKGINQTLRVLEIGLCPRLKKLISGLHLLTNCQFKFDFDEAYTKSCMLFPIVFHMQAPNRT